MGIIRLIGPWGLLKWDSNSGPDTVRQLSKRRTDAGLRPLERTALLGLQTYDLENHGDVFISRQGHKGCPWRSSGEDTKLLLQRTWV